MTFKCKKCGEDWTFFPEDYDYKKVGADYYVDDKIIKL